MKKESRKARTAIEVAGVTLGIATIFLAVTLLQRQPPSLLDDIEAESLPSQAITKIEFFRELPGPRTALQAHPLKSEKTNAEVFEELCKALTKQTKRRTGEQEHLSDTSSPHTLEIRFSDDSKYVLNYTVFQKNGDYFAIIDSFPIKKTPSDSPEKKRQKLMGLGQGPTTYESLSFVEFTQKYDPWYLTPDKTQIDPELPTSE